MPADPAFAAVPAHLNPVIQGDLWLSWIAREGLTALALPPEAGGQGGTLAELGRAARTLARHAPGAAISADSYWAHRASGVRGAVLRMLEKTEAGRPVQRSEMKRLVDLGFIILETVADQQQYNFQTEKYRRLADKKDPGPYATGFVDTGLWSLCRHPNYAAEQLVWVSFYFCSVAATGRLLNWSVSGCILLMLLFLGGSDFSEKISASQYPGYAGYMASKPRFWPAFVKK